MNYLKIPISIFILGLAAEPQRALALEADANSEPKWMGQVLLTSDQVKLGAICQETLADSGRTASGKCVVWKYTLWNGMRSTSLGYEISMRTLPGSDSISSLFSESENCSKKDAVALAGLIQQVGTKQITHNRLNRIIECVNSIDAFEDPRTIAEKKRITDAAIAEQKRIDEEKYRIEHTIGHSTNYSSKTSLSKGQFRITQPKSYLPDSEESLPISPRSDKDGVCKLFGFTQGINTNSIDENFVSSRLCSITGFYECWDQPAPKTERIYARINNRGSFIGVDKERFVLHRGLQHKLLGSLEYIDCE